MSDLQIVRIAVLGSLGVGKSALCDRFVNAQFKHSYPSSNEVQSFRKTVAIPQSNNKKIWIMLEIDDVFAINHPDLMESSSEGNSMSAILDAIIENKRLYERDKQKNPVYKEHPISCYILMFDTGNIESFKILQSFVDVLVSTEEKKLGYASKKKTVKYLVANKADHLNWAVPLYEIEIVKNKYALNFVKTSALTNKNIEHLFIEIARSIIDRRGLKVEDAALDEGQTEEETVSRGFLDLCDCSKGRNKGRGDCQIQ